MFTHYTMKKKTFFFIYTYLHIHRQTHTLIHTDAHITIFHEYYSQILTHVHNRNTLNRTIKLIPSCNETNSKIYITSLSQTENYLSNEGRKRRKQSFVSASNFALTVFFFQKFPKKKKIRTNTPQNNNHT